MKKLLALILALMILASTSAFADWNVDSLTDDELLDYRRAITAELAARRLSQMQAADGSTIEELFPDEWLAAHIRDELGKFKVTDVVTQDELDTIKKLRVNGQTTDHIQITTLEGVQYLHNLVELSLTKQDNITEIPDWIGSLVFLESLTFRYCPIKDVPDGLCDLVALTELDLDGTDIEALPEEIGNLENLKRLNISGTKITSLPESIYALQLEKFYREGLNIEE